MFLKLSSTEKVFDRSNGLGVMERVGQVQSSLQKKCWEQIRIKCLSCMGYTNIVYNLYNLHVT